MRGLFFWGAMPFLLPQALYVKKHAPRFPPAAGPTRGRIGSGPPLRLVAIGDSIIAGVGARALSKALVGQTSAALATLLNREVCWTAIGRNGANSRAVLRELAPKLSSGSADVFVVSVGVNDVTSLTTLAIWTKNIKSLLDTLRSHSPDALISVAGLPPLHEFPLLPEPLRSVLGVRARMLDEELRDIVAASQNSIFVPLQFDPAPDKWADDGYHPSERGYHEYGSETARQIAVALDAH